MTNGPSPEQRGRSRWSSVVSARPILADDDGDDDVDEGEQPVHGTPPLGSGSTTDRSGEVMTMHSCGCTGDNCPHEQKAEDMRPPKPGTEDEG